MTSLERRITQLEAALDVAEDRPPLAERLHAALDRARARRRQGLPLDPRPALEGPPPREGTLADRLRKAQARVQTLRRAIHPSPPAE
jgi:hypothetical protein